MLNTRKMSALKKGRTRGDSVIIQTQTNNSSKQKRRKSTNLGFCEKWLALPIVVPKYTPGTGVTGNW